MRPQPEQQHAKRLRQIKVAGKKKTAKCKPKARRLEGGVVLDEALAALIRWSQQVHGLTADVRRTSGELERDLHRANATEFIRAIQSKRNILEELYMWLSETRAQPNASEAAAIQTQLKEGAVLLDVLFGLLSSEFDIEPMHEPGEIIATPSKKMKNYRFRERREIGLEKSIVISPGLRQGKTIISPCEISQSEG
jgi:hypothetical protein